MIVFNNGNNDSNNNNIVATIMIKVISPLKWEILNLPDSQTDNVNHQVIHSAPDPLSPSNSHSQASRDLPRAPKLEIPGTNPSAANSWRCSATL